MGLLLKAQPLDCQVAVLDKAQDWWAFLQFARTVPVNINAFLVCGFLSVCYKELMGSFLRRSLCHWLANGPKIAAAWLDCAGKKMLQPFEPNPGC